MNNYSGYVKIIFALPMLALNFYANAQAVHTNKVNIGFAYRELNIRVFFYHLSEHLTAQFLINSDKTRVFNQFFPNSYAWTYFNADQTFLHIFSTICSSQIRKNLFPCVFIG